MTRSADLAWARSLRVADCDTYAALVDERGQVVARFTLVADAYRFAKVIAQLQGPPA